jgi:polygalacturonase
MTTIKLSVFFLLILAATIEAQVSVMNFGAQGDGKTDDVKAIEKALLTHGSVSFPKGIYRISRTIIIPLSESGFTAISGDGTARIVMAGAGPAFFFKGTHEGTAAPTTVKPGVWEKERTPMISGIEIIGDHAEADGIEAAGTMQLTLSRVVIRQCRHAMHLTTRNRNVLIADCHFYDNRGIGIFLDQLNLHQINVVGCHISYNAGGGIVSRGGEVRNLHIGTCDIEGNHAVEGAPSANVELNSTGGSIAEVAITGCTLQHTSKAAGSANIRILGAGTDPSLERRVGRAHTREGNVTISANVFSDVRTNIEIREARGVTITGNTFWEGFDQDLLAENCEHLVISNNNFDRNPRYAVNGFKDAENNGIRLIQCSDSSLMGNVISGVWRQRAAVDIVGGNRLMIVQNHVLDSDGIGLRLEEVNHSLIMQNMIRDDRPEEKRSHEPSLLALKGTGNNISSNMLSNPTNKE